MEQQPQKDKTSQKKGIEAKEKNETSLPAETPAVDRTEDAGSPQSGVGSMVEAGNIDKIRTILFGSQMRDIEKRFARLEERMLKDMTELREEMRKRAVSLEEYVNKEVESLDNRLKAEQDARAESVKGLSEELNDTVKSFEKKTGKLDEQLNKIAREFRQQILEQSKSLSDEIRQKNEETAAVLERVAQELRTDKVDRNTLSELFMQMAMRLPNDTAMELNLEMGELKNE